MLEELRISGSAIIMDAELELSTGLTVLTGETGAGKTSVLTALLLLAGGKAEAAPVHGDRLAVEALFSTSNPDVAELIAQAGGDLDEESLVVRRTVSSEGRSRAFAGGVAVPATLLSELAPYLSAIHGQSDQLLLRRAGLQRDLLDRYAGSDHQDRVQEHRAFWNEREKLQAQIATLTTDSASRLAAREEALAGIATIDAVNPLANEDVELKSEAMRLEHVDELLESVGGALAALIGEEGHEDSPGINAAAGVAQSRRNLAAAVGRDGELASVAASLDEVQILIDDVASSLRNYQSQLGVEPGRLAQVQQRRSQLGELIRRFAAVDKNIDEVLQWRASAQELVEKSSDDEQLAELLERVTELGAALGGSAEVITQTRTRAAADLSERVTVELQSLAMPRAVLEALVSDADPGAFGNDGVAFLLRPRPDSPGVALHKGASGGELSRVMLALEVVLAGADPVDTFVFDEVDAGVGGRAAVDVGLRLAQLGSHCQVIVVTHLPQVAAFADHHFVVTRSKGDERAQISRLNNDDRAGELTRMLAGLEDSTAGKAHAVELLATAAELKQKASA